MSVSLNNQISTRPFLKSLVLSVFAVSLPALLMTSNLAVADTTLTLPTEVPSVVSQELSQGIPQELPKALTPVQPSKPVRLKPISEVEILKPSENTTGKRTSTSVQMNTLSSIDPDAVGTLTAQDGGFGATMWSGTSRRFIERMIPMLPVHSRSGTMRDLMHRMLLSQARLPQVQVALAPIPTTNPEVISESIPENEYVQESERLVLVRLRALNNMGDIEGVSQLINVISNRGDLEEISRLEANSLLIANKIPEACVIAANEIRKHDLVFWQQLHTFCLALAGEHDTAAMNLSMMEEMGDRDDLFSQLVYALNSNTAEPIEALPEPTPLRLAMFKAASMPLPADVITTNDVQILRAVALDPEVPMEVRLEMAERAEDRGGLSVEKLREMFSAIEFKRDELANVLTKADEEAGPVVRALLYQAAVAEKFPVASAEIIAKALKLGREEGRYFSVVRVFLPVLQTIVPSSDMLWFAPDAVRALMAGGDGQGASLWLRVLESRAARKAGFGEEMDILLPIIRLMGYGGANTNTNVSGLQDQMLANWWQAVQDREDIHGSAVLVYSLFEGQGAPVKSKAWEDLIIGDNHQEASYPDPAIWMRLQALTRQIVAAKEAMQGTDNIPVAEIVTLSLMALGNDGVSQVSGPVLVDVVKGLRAVGLEKEATNLIGEALLAAGL